MFIRYKFITFVSYNSYTNVTGVYYKETIRMAKREVMMLYGEKTVQVNYRVPESKKDEIDVAIKAVLKRYENPQRIEIDVRESEQRVSKDIASKKPVTIHEAFENIEKKSNPADDTMEVVIEHKPPEWATKHKHVIKSTTAEFEVGKIESQVVETKAEVESLPETAKFVSSHEKRDKVKELQALADLIKNGGGPKTSSFTTVKKPIDEIYDCIIVEKGIPVESDRVYYGSNNRIAFWDRDDASVYYANWENKYYRFANSKEFNKFCKDNQIK